MLGDLLRTLGEGARLGLGARHPHRRRERTEAAEDLAACTVALGGGKPAFEDSDSLLSGPQVEQGVARPAAAQPSQSASDVSAARERLTSERQRSRIVAAAARDPARRVAKQNSSVAFSPIRSLIASASATRRSASCQSRRSSGT